MTQNNNQTATKTIAERREFISSLELTREPSNKLARGKVSSENEGNTAFVDDGSLVSFVSGLSALHRSDVLDSTLLAQLAANKRFDRYENTDDWYKFYLEVLENVGWVVQSFEFTQYEAEGTSFTMDKVVLEILRSIATQDEEQIIQSTIDALEALDDGSGALVLFDDSSSSQTQGSFQISIATEDDGNVAMKLGAYYFSAEKVTTRFLWFQYSKTEIEMFKGAQQVVLNESVYSQVRDTVIEKLGDSSHEFIAELEI